MCASAKLGDTPQFRICGHELIF